MANDTRILRAAYLYSDGTLVKWFTEKRKGVEIGDTADVHYGFTEPIRWQCAQMGGHGRIVISECEQGILAALKGKRLEVSPESLENGSNNSRAKNIAVGHIIVREPKDWRRSFSILTFDGLISTGFTIQPASKPLDYSTLDYRWDECRVLKTVGERPKQESETQAA